MISYQYRICHRDHYQHKKANHLSGNKKGLPYVSEKLKKQKFASILIRERPKKSI